MNTTELELELGADRAHSYSHLVIELFKKLDADPTEALTALVVTAAAMAHGLGVTRGTIDTVIKETFDQVYAIPFDVDAEG